MLRMLRRQGVELSADGDRLRYRSPAGVMTPALVDQLATQKREVLALLAAPPPPALDAAGDPIGPCLGCGGALFWHWPTFDPRHLADAWSCYRCSPIPPGAGAVDACCVPDGRPVDLGELPPPPAA